MWRNRGGDTEWRAFQSISFLGKMLGEALEESNKAGLEALVLLVILAVVMAAEVVTTQLRKRLI